MSIASEYGMTSANSPRLTCQPMYVVDIRTVPYLRLLNRRNLAICFRRFGAACPHGSYHCMYVVSMHTTDRCRRTETDSPAAINFRDRHSRACCCRSTERLSVSVNPWQVQINCAIKPEVSRLRPSTLDFPRLELARFHPSNLPSSHSSTAPLYSATLHAGHQLRFGDSRWLLP